MSIAGIEKVREAENESSTDQKSSEEAFDRI